jgi:hypothetical protein
LLEISEMRSRGPGAEKAEISRFASSHVGVNFYLPFG